MFDGKIELSDWHHCAAGHQRSIFAHPLYPNVLIKVLKPESRGEGGTRRSKRRLRFLNRFKRFGAYRTFQREVDEFLEQARRFSLADRVELPIPRIFGFANTDYGLGLIVEKITMSNGEIAPTLRELALSGRLTATHLKMIDELFERFCRLHIVMMDVNPGNFVVTDRRGFEELICVDGTGEKSPLHIFAFSRRMNEARLRRMRAKLLTKLAGTLACSVAVSGDESVRAALGRYQRQTDQRTRSIGLSPDPAH
ncbi:YrbL family protein [Sinorhizobium psoraleae]|uniref:YrbL family protein n=1 Tax=Sinorhizobium psoraleae TaxID=520838 RepID=A0ABT4KUX1_9HYPH|nr:YrbL family protein [Sinorhizobium psoraleae]MCZ4094677.1 YrbL family protein [Sinorhizobium psoraleae]